VGWRAGWLVVLLVVVAAEQETYVMIDQEEAAHTQEVVAHPRVERGAEEEGSGGLLGNHFADYGIDDEDQASEYGSTNIVSSRVVPVASSPVFSLPPTTRPPSPGTSAPPPRHHGSTPGGPARPPRLSSYYPGGAEGSGGDYISTLRDYNNTDDLISPTRTQGGPSGPASSMTPRLPPDQTPPTNHEPFINSRLDKVPLTAGKSSRIIIPANTFQDLEDGDTRDLSLSIVDRDTGEPLNDLTWARFSPVRQEILLLPLEENIGLYNFRVAATDSGGETQQDTLVISVRQQTISRTFHHQFTSRIVIANPGRFRHPVDWKLRLLDILVSFFGDSDASKVTVLDLSQTPGQPAGHVTFRWTNDSLPRQSCPREAVNSLFRQLSTNQQPTPGFRAAMEPAFRVRGVTLTWKGLCDVRQQPGVVTNHPTARTEYDNSMPQIRNPVDKLNVTAGELLQYQVPSDMCWDKENGGTRDLNLQLLTVGRLEVDGDNWLQFDARNQEFVGVPLENDVGREEYQLVCSDSEGYSAIDGIEVSVLSRPFYEKFNVLFVFVFNDTLDDGARLARSRVKLTARIAKIFRDSDTSHIVLNKVDSGTYEVAWYNKSLTTRECPVEQIAATRNFLLTKEGAVRQRVVQAFEPGFHLAEVKLVNQGACLDVINPSPDTTGDPIHDLLPHQEYLLAFVVPALIIVSMLLLAVLIACILHRKRKAGKLDMFKTEALPPRIPVIMQDELSEDNFNMSKQPIILREEPHHASGFSSFGAPPQYYGSRDEEFSECESLVNSHTGGTLHGHGMAMGGMGGTLPSHHTPYSRPPPVALEFSDSLARSRHRPAPHYRRGNFHP